jgi:hypothetical protein
MSTTAKALIIGTFVALAGLVLLQLTVRAPVAQLEPVVVTAKRPAAEPRLIQLAPVSVTATREQAQAARLEEATKQANASLRKGG